MLPRSLAFVVLRFCVLVGKIGSRRRLDRFGAGLFEARRLRFGIAAERGIAGHLDDPSARFRCLAFGRPLGHCRMLASGFVVFDR